MAETRLASKFARTHVNTTAICNRICTVPCKQAVQVQNSSVQKFVWTRVNGALTFIGGKFDRCIHAWIGKFYSCTLYKNCIEKLFKLLQPLLFVQCWFYEGRKGKQGIMFCLRPGLTSEWSVFKKLSILLYACLPSPSARRRREEKSSASTTLTRETS